MEEQVELFDLSQYESKFPHNEMLVYKYILYQKGVAMGFDAQLEMVNRLELSGLSFIINCWIYGEENVRTFSKILKHRLYDKGGYKRTIEKELSNES